MPYEEDKNKRTFKLRPKQKAFVENTAKFSFYVGGLGAGKTFAGAVRTLIYVTKYPGSLGLIGAPTFTMLRDTTMRTFFDLCPPNLIKHHNKNELKTTFINDTEILWRSMDDPDKCRGINLSWFWLDEAPFCGYYSWKVLKARAGRQDPKRFPTAGWCTGTPKGKDGFYEDFEFKPKKDHFLVRASTWENAVNLPEGYVEGLGYEGAFAQQEVEGRFEAFEGLVYSFGAERGMRGSHIMPSNVAFKLPTNIYLVEDFDKAGNFLGHKKVTEEEVPAGAEIVGLTRTLIGVDWGFKNPAVCLVLGVDNDDRIWQIYEFYQRGVSREKMFIPHIVETARLFEVSRVYCDPAEPQSIVDLRAKMDEEQVDCSVQPGDNNRISGISTVRSFLSMREDGRPGLLVHESCKSTIQEYGSYQYPTKEVRDRNPSEVPLEQNDHAMGCVRYVLFTEFGLGRNGTIASAGTHTGDGDDAIGAAEKALKGEDDLLVVRGHQAARVLRELDSKYGLVRDKLFRVDTW
ncbi:MAG: phage terminase large subunit [Ktedonobacterales bacterium]